MKKEILLVSDFVGVGKVALSAMIPIISSIGVKASYLPTAIVSNNFGYGEAALEDLTGFMEASLDVWKKHGFNFDIIATGILMNERQADLVEEIINWHEERPFVIVDPIMGDGGKIYPGLSQDLVLASRKMAAVGDLLVPNLTELALILGLDYKVDMDHQTMVEWLELLKDRGVKSVATTSVKIGGKYFVYGYGLDGEIFSVEYRHLPIEIGGAGDVFTSLLVGRYEKDRQLKKSIEYATGVLTNIIEEEVKRGVGPRAIEIEVERYLDYINKTVS